MLIRDAEPQLPRPRRITAAPQRVNWWLRLTSAGWDKPQYTVVQRELARRSRLASWLILGLLLALVVVSPLVTGDTQTLVAFSLFAAGLTLCAVLNRRGLVNATGAILVTLIILVIMGPTVTSPLGLTMGQLPNYDALAIAVLVAATLLPRWAIFAVAGLNSAIVVADFTLRPHHPNVQQDAALYASPTLQTISLLVRPIALELMVAVVAYLWIRGTDEAIRRADRAEEIAQLEQREAERARDLTEGVQQLLAVHVRLANGDFRARAPQVRSPQLAQIGQSLNSLINRLARFAQADAVLQRTHVEATRLADALQRARQGQPFTIPPASGTPLDPVVETLRLQAQRSGRMSQPRSDAQEPSSSPFSQPLSNPFPSSQYSTPASQPLSERRQQLDPSLPEWLRPPESGEPDTPDAQ
ncbi:MAG TPA: hypothetical protein VHR15_07145 [Ktedonobacterales bacterium]|nr:hypothetical protein [Ktedonobacterales bacterium]